MESIKKSIGQRLNEALALSGKMQKELAREIGVPDNTISYFVSGKRTPNPELLIKISQYLNVTVDYLLGLTDVASTNIDVKAICEYTGLSEAAVKNLHMFYKIREKGDKINCYTREAQNLLLSSLTQPFYFVARYKDNMEKLVAAEKSYLNAIIQSARLEPTDTKEKVDYSSARKSFEAYKEARLSLFEAVEYMRGFTEEFAEYEIKQHNQLQEAIAEHRDKLIASLETDESDKGQGE